MNKMTVEEIAAQIPSVVETEQTRIGLLWDERLEIAKAILEKYNITPKEDE